MGVIAARSNDLSKAAELIGEAILADPTNPAALSDRGVALKALRQFEGALADFDQAITVQPDYAPAYNNRGNLLRELRQWDAALASYDRAVEIDPRYSDAHNNRGVLLTDLNRWEAAVASFDEADRGKSPPMRMRSAIGVWRWNVWIVRTPALASYDRALRLDPAHVLALANRGNVLRQLQLVNSALSSCNRAIALSPNLAAAHQNKAMALLSLGELETGWAELEWRWKNENNALFAERRGFRQPLWLGEAAPSGRTLLLHSEQGMGDTLQFCRYAPMAARSGAEVVLEVPQPLVSLMSTLEGVSRVVARGAPLPDFDLHCPLMSLPLAFKTTLGSIPANVPYLHADAHKSRLWEERLGARTGLRVGLVWSGGFRPNQPEIWAVDNRRNIPLAMLAPLRHPAVEFYTLQKGEPAESELAKLRSNRRGRPAAHRLHRSIARFCRYGSSHRTARPGYFRRYFDCPSGRCARQAGLDIESFRHLLALAVGPARLTLVSDGKNLPPGKRRQLGIGRPAGRR